jgi:hypothetical protein
MRGFVSYFWRIQGGKINLRFCRFNNTTKNTCWVHFSCVVISWVFKPVQLSTGHDIYCTNSEGLTSSTYSALHRVHWLCIERDSRWRTADCRHRGQEHKYYDTFSKLSKLNMIFRWKALEEHFLRELLNFSSNLGRKWSVIFWSCQSFRI